MLSFPCCLHFQRWQSIQWYYQHYPETPGAESGQSLHRCPGPGGPDRNHRQMVILTKNIKHLYVINMKYAVFLPKYFWDETFWADIFKICQNGVTYFYILPLPGKPCLLSQVPYRWFPRWTLTAWTQSVGATLPPHKNQTPLLLTVRQTTQPSARIVLLLMVRRSINSVRWCVAAGGDHPYIHRSRELITMRCP